MLKSFMTPLGEKHGSQHNAQAMDPVSQLLDAFPSHADTCGISSKLIKATLDAYSYASGLCELAGSQG
jgi:hypothetical protein